MDFDKIYESYSIPNREVQRIVERLRSNYQVKPSLTELNNEAFAEIDIDVPEHAAPAAKAQAVSPVNDKMRDLFYSIRQASYGISDRSGSFYRQALIAKDIDDYYDEETPFTSYFPYYQQMGYSQLRTYFTWRTKVRNGEISDTSVSYAFLYVYELITNIGVADPQDGLDKLVGFWQAFREYTPVLDKYLLQWLKDYHVYYPLKTSFLEFACAHNLQINYPTVFGYQSGQDDSFELFSSISQYEIKKSIFYNEQTKKLINDCFFFVLSRLRKMFQKKNKCFEDYVFNIIKKKSIWIPFDRALFYPVLKQQDRIVNISQREEYECRNERWTYKTAVLTEHGSQLIGYIMKEMEANLRIREKFKYKLKVNHNSYMAADKPKLQELGIDLSEQIREGVAAYYAYVSWKTVSVDSGNLAHIRKEAFKTQEKLLVPDDIELEIHEPVASAPVTPPAADGWSDFKAALTQTEIEALRLILYGQDVKSYAAGMNIMLEVLIDSINDKAVDTVNDTPLETGDTVFVYEEYADKLMEVVNS